MKREPVDSSSITTVGFDPSSHTLEIEFRDGKVYQYFDVPAQVFEKLMAAESLGRFLTKEIRGVYRYARV